MLKEFNSENNRLSKGMSYFITIAALNVVNPFFLSKIFAYLLILFIFLVILAASKKVKLFDKKIMLILISIYLLTVIQSLVSQRISPAAIYHPILFFYIPFLIYKLLGLSFYKYFVNVLFFIAIITTPLWFLQSTMPFFDDFLQKAIDLSFQYNWDSQPRSLLIFTAAWSNLIFNQNFEIYRNSGIFHEPGGYAVFLILGIVINSLINKKFFDIKNIIFTFCILTTLSTAGYISLSIILFAFLFKIKLPYIIKVISILGFVLLSIYIYESEDFLKEKVILRYESEHYAMGSSYMGRTTIQRGRFFAFYMAMNTVLNSPIWGKGIIQATSPTSTGELHPDTSSGYGLMGMIATYGIFFGSFFTFGFYKGLKRINLSREKRSLFVFMLFTSLMFAVSTQSFFRTTVFVTIFILGIYSSFDNSTKKPKIDAQKQLT